MLVSGLSSQFSSQIKPSEPLGSKQPNNNDSDNDLEEPSSSVKSDVDSEEKSTQASVSEQRELQKLKSRDREVRAHELAHVSVGGRYITSGAQFSYQKGSNGQLYAVAGEVGINTSEVPGDPRATLLKAQVIARAAMAPANPSAQDINVAAQAAVLIQQARVDLAALLSETSTSDVGQNLDAFA